MSDVWNDRDRVLGLRDQLARLVAAKISGEDPEEVVPENFDFELADDIAKLIHERFEKHVLDILD